ncbi:hypothetical protein ACFW6V_17705 [Streptomyces sp. NPDC058734]|uniref:hypothetical protein n=1 Tax=Streptomyces sp. NPDC058734 TaxID=3346615 RepID=UPI0036991588
MYRPHVYVCNAPNSYGRYMYQCRCGHNSGRTWYTSQDAMKELRKHVAKRHGDNERFRPVPYRSL